MRSARAVATQRGQLLDSCQLYPLCTRYQGVWAKGIALAGAKVDAHLPIDEAITSAEKRTGRIYSDTGVRAPSRSGHAVQGKVAPGIWAGTCTGRASSPRRNAFRCRRSASWAIRLLRAEEFLRLMRVRHAAAATHATHRTPRGTRPAQSPPSRSHVACGWQAPTASAPPRRRCRPHPARH